MGIRYTKHELRREVLQAHLLGSRSRLAGFTLIELLLVVAIIGLLSSMTLVAVTGMRERARDAKRFTDVRTIAQGLRLFYDDNQAYPSIPFPSGPVMRASSNEASWNFLRLALVSNYISALTKDPKNARINGSWYLYSYFYDPNGTYCPGMPGYAYLVVNNFEARQTNHGATSTCSRFDDDYPNGYLIVLPPSA